MRYEDEITAVKGIGEKTQKGFAKLDIFTIQDLIEHYPRNYDVYGEIRSIQSLREDETAVIEVSVDGADENEAMAALEELVANKFGEA